MSAMSIIKTLYFVRHGETELNAAGVLQGSGTDLGLNSRGRQQAEYLRDHLASCDFDLAVTSNLMRSMETAKIVLEKYPSIPIIQAEELHEISWGDLEGQPNIAVKPIVQSWNEGNYDGNKRCPIYC